MPEINWLSGTCSYRGISTGDQIPIYSQANGDTRRISINQLLQLFEQTFASPEVATTLYVPATGFNIAIGTPTSNLWALLQPAGTLATGTVTLPLNTVTPDGTELLVTTTQIITSFTLGANGAAATFGAPTTLAANALFKMRFYLATNSWYRVG